MDRTETKAETTFEKEVRKSKHVDERFGTEVPIMPTSMQEDMTN